MRTTRLVAILFAEIDGFAELLERDEKAALSILAEYRAIADPIISEHGGEIVDATGEELLVLFESAVSAVQCAVHLDLAIRARAEGLPSSARFGVRAGVHLGEIWRDESRVYGNGVNVAARVKQAAFPGTILISEDVECQISNKLDLDLREIPRAGLRNIERSLRLFVILREGVPMPSKIPPAAAPPIREPALSAMRDMLVAARAARARGDSATFRTSIGPDDRLRVRVRIDSEDGEDEGEDDDEEDEGSVPVPVDLEAARSRLISGCIRIGLGLAAGGASLWLYLDRGGFWFGAAAVALGLLPLASGMKRALVSAMDIGDARRRQRRKDRHA